MMRVSRRRFIQSVYAAFVTAWLPLWTQRQPHAGALARSGLTVPFHVAPDPPRFRVWLAQVRRGH